jgi:hypothetical protein
MQALFFMVSMLLTIFESIDPFIVGMSVQQKTSSGYDPFGKAVVD